MWSLIKQSALVVAALCTGVACVAVGGMYSEKINEACGGTVSDKKPLAGARARARPGGGAEVCPPVPMHSYRGRVADFPDERATTEKSYSGAHLGADDASSCYVRERHGQISGG